MAQSSLRLRDVLLFINYGLNFWIMLFFMYFCIELTTEDRHRLASLI